MASDMEKRHRRTYLERVNPETGLLRPEVLAALLQQLNSSPKPWLLFCQHATIAKAVATSLSITSWASTLITGSTSKRELHAGLTVFKTDSNPKRVLVGTSTIATGTDGLDVVCDQLLIFDDIVGDDSKRRQLIGRVLPRGTATRPTTVVMTTVAE